MTTSRTWPYGTKLKGVVLQPLNPPERFGKWLTSAQVVKDENGEGHVLVGAARDLDAKEGDSGTLEFMQGGPTGGYFKFTKDAKK